MITFKESHSEKSMDFAARRVKSSKARPRVNAAARVRRKILADLFRQYLIDRGPREACRVGSCNDSTFCTANDADAVLRRKARFSKTDISSWKNQISFRDKQRERRQYYLYGK